MRVTGTTYTKSAPPLQFRCCSTEAPNGGNLWELYNTAAIQDGFLLALNLLFQPPKCAQLAIVIMEPGVSSETGLLHPSSGTGLTSAVLKCQPSQQTSSPFAWLCLALNFQQRPSKVMAAVVKWGHRESRHCCTGCSETHLHSATTCSWHSCLQWYLHITPLYPSRFSSTLLQCVPTLSFLQRGGPHHSALLSWPRTLSAAQGILRHRNTPSGGRWFARIPNSFQQSSEHRLNEKEWNVCAR